MAQKISAGAVVAAILSLHLASCSQTPEGAQKSLSDEVGEAGLGAVAEFDCSKVTDTQRACLKYLGFADDTDRREFLAELYFVVKQPDGTYTTEKVFKISSEEQDTSTVVEARTEAIMSVAQVNQLLGQAKWEAIEGIAERILDTVTVLRPDGSAVSTLTELRQLRQQGGEGAQPALPSSPQAPAPSPPVDEPL